MNQTTPRKKLKSKKKTEKRADILQHVKQKANFLQTLIFFIVPPVIFHLMLSVKNQNKTVLEISRKIPNSRNLPKFYCFAQFPFNRDQESRNYTKNCKKNFF